MIIINDNDSDITHLSVTKVGVINTLAIAAVLGAPGTGLDLAHERQQGLTPNDNDDNDGDH